MDYVYPAIFHANDDGSYTVIYPDLTGCISEGKSLNNALFMAQAALTQWVEYELDSKRQLPDASSVGKIALDSGEFVNLIRVEVRDNRAVRRTVSIPKWMDDQAVSNGLSLSRVLQDALSSRLSR
ncbi:MAG: type II toxin-antitoxin system HicB family antitoxin [Oscillospiraceae bacterium]|jgi:predicted RNase H-like HicB family nuclease|nr:type II toxin-antitoxin system HicB family antitoxin [Oscillospiraceae bacterium]